MLGADITRYTLYYINLCKKRKKMCWKHFKFDCLLHSLRLTYADLDLILEYINIALLDLCRRYHEAMEHVDITDVSLSSLTGEHPSLRVYLKGCRLNRMLRCKCYTMSTLQKTTISILLVVWCGVLPIYTYTRLKNSDNICGSCGTLLLTGCHNSYSCCQSFLTMLKAMNSSGMFYHLVE